VSVEVELGPGARAVADEEGLRLASRRLRREAPWNTLTGGGLVRARTIEFEAMGAEALELLPGLGRLAAASRKMTDAHRLLVLAQARARGRPRAFLVSIPVDDPNAEALLAEVKRRLGSRWRGEDWELSALKRDLGASYPRWYWPAGLLFALFIAAVSVPAIAGWGALTQEADLDRLRAWWLAGLAGWLVVVALLFFVTRRSLGQTSWRPSAIAAALVLLLAVLAPAAIASYRLAADWNWSELKLETLAVLVLWLGLATVVVAFVRRRLG
jgi:hypothetical protein